MPALYLVRHGPTALNDAGRLRGWMDPPLTAAGFEQATRLVLPKLPIYASSLTRAVQTAKQIGHAEVVDALRPWNVGIYAGQPSEIVHPQLVEFQRNGRRVPFGEPWNEFVKRFQGFIRTLRHDSILVTHFRNCKLMLAWQAGKFERIDNATLFADDVSVCEVLKVVTPW